MLNPLPIDAHLPEICRSVADHPITLIEAPPGSGKTTRVAPALMEQAWTQGKRIYLLQPRRLAAKSVGQRIAFEQGSRIGNRIGYQVRFDSQVTSQTQLIVATEGVLLRRLQDDPSIDDTAIVLLDEFHERSLDADLLLGMLRRVQAEIRSDLKIVIMSATIESDAIQARLANLHSAAVPILRVASKNFPVEIRYRPPLNSRWPVDHMIATLQEVAPKHDGDILAFLPGAGDIRRCHDELSRSSLGRDCEIVMLYGSMQLEDQSRVIESRSSDSSAKRKIVLSTNIAETSLTIEGVRVVVDSGLARVMRFSPDVGLDRLSLESISQASATQRMGRAGRVAPGVCYRLWSEASDRARPAFLEPEIRRTDIVGAVLQLFAWGEGDSDDFPWLEPPRPDSMHQAKQLLKMLGAIEDGKISSIGKKMSKLPTQPRLARMILAGSERGCLDRVCLLAAMLSERDPFDRASTQGNSRTMATRSARRWDSDCLERLHAVESYLAKRFTGSPFGQLHHASVHSIAQSATQLKQQCQALNPVSNAQSRTTIGAKSAETSDDALLLQSMVFGFPDRLAKRRGIGKNTGLMVGGKGVVLGPESGVTESELFLCIDVEGSSGDAVVRQASRVEPDWLPLDLLEEQDELFFHASQKQVVARRRTKWFDLVLNETPTSIRNGEECGQVLLEAALKHWDQAFPVGDEFVDGLVARVNCLREWLPSLDLPVLDELFFQEIAEDLCRTRRSLSELKSAPWKDWIQAKFTNEQWQLIEREAPAKLMVPSGSWIKIRYQLGKPPTMSVKIQELFSLRETPRVGLGRVAILLELLSPNMRPQQITSDLSSFWANGYPIVKKELKRRYPKHSWPDDPLTATPGRR
jgi:ATP-dependent helicase HrpB